MTDRAQAILDHLNQEAGVISSGEYARLGDMARRKESLLLALSEGEPDAQDLARIGKAAAKNMRLLKAAMRGIADAEARLIASRKAQSKFETYGPNGKIQVHGNGKPAFDGKA